MTKAKRFGVPTGLGMFDQRINFSSPMRAVDRLSALGVRWYSVCGPWQDHRTGETKFINPPEKIAKFAETLSRAGIATHVWGYPHPRAIERFVDALVECIAPGVIAIGHDAEQPFKKRESEARVLAAGVREVSKRRRVAAFGTSYGTIKFHKTFPYHAFVDAVDFWCPQEYLFDALIDADLEAAVKVGFECIVPILGLFKFAANRKAVPKTPDELHAHLSEGVDSPVPFDAFGLWEASFLERYHDPIIKRWASWLARGATRLPSQ